VIEAGRYDCPTVDTRAPAGELRRLLSPDGELLGPSTLPPEEVRRLYRAMVAARVYDRKGSALQRQGRLATYAPYEGQEAAQIGAVAALRPDDWLVATYRDAAAMWFHGYPWELLLLGRMGDERGGSPPEGVWCLPPSITVGAHMLHAVGLAWAEKLQGRDRIALTSFGDGATSEGDFHEAMNFAAVYATPTVFLCQNNQYAISLRRDRQTRSETIAVKAVAYGMPGALVDGNDVLAVHEAVRDAAERARAGGGPTLIEALTYRLGPHTTADDPGRYRDEDEAEAWRPLDPLERVRRWLEASGAWDQAWQQAIEEEESAAIERAVEQAEALPAQDASGPFAAMFASPTRQLEEQRELLRQALTDEGGSR
jgi:pyruvate dehydrogenase E1 component alpha subunit